MKENIPYGDFPARLLAAGCLFILAGCSPTGPETPPSPPPPPAAGVAGVAGDLRFEVPAAWVAEAPTSSMRLAQYRIPGADENGGAGELVVFYFGGQGGGVQANVDRWIGQFTTADGSPAGENAIVSEQESGGLRLTRVDVSGTYHESRGPMMGQTTPREGYRMLAVVVEGPGGPWFLKLTGPGPTIQEAESAFLSLLETLRVAS